MMDGVIDMKRRRVENDSHPISADLCHPLHLVPVISYPLQVVSIDACEYVYALGVCDSPLGDALEI